MPTFFDYASTASRNVASDGRYRRASDASDLRGKPSSQDPAFCSGLSPAMPRSILKSTPHQHSTISSPARSPGTRENSLSSRGHLSSTVLTDVSSKDVSWEINTLVDKDGKLDVDAVSHALGIGLGLGLVNDSCSATSSPPPSPAVESVGDLSDEGSEPSPSLCPGSCTFGWGTPDQFVGLAGVMSGMRAHIPGMPLCVIPEETKSEMGSVLESICGEEGGDSGIGALSMGMDSEDAGYKTARDDLTGLSATGMASKSGGWDESWREDESR